MVTMDRDDLEDLDSDTSEIDLDTPDPAFPNGDPKASWPRVFNEAKERLKKALAAWSEPRKAYKDDFDFCILKKQWDEGVEAWRKSHHRPCLVYDQTGALIRSMTNKVRRSPRGAKLHPEGTGANKDTAMLLEGIYRRVFSVSHGDQVAAYAYTCKGIGGLGFWRVAVETRRGRDGQERYQIRMERIRDPLCVVPDPHFQSIDGLDQEFLFYLDVVSKSRFKRDYKGETPSSFCDEIQCDEDSVVLAHYWRKDENGAVEQFILNGEKVLWSTTQMDDSGRIMRYQGHFIPFVGVWGEDYHGGDKSEYKSLCRDVKDVAKLINYAESDKADRVTKAPRPQWLLETRHVQEEAIQNQWNNPNADGSFYLLYSYVDGVPMPQAMQPAPLPAGLMEIGRDAKNDLRQIVGIPNPVEDIPASQSGKAIRLQMDERDIQTYGFLDGYDVALKANAVVVIDLIQSYITQPDWMTVQGPDGQVSTVRVNEPYRDENGKEVFHDLDAGDYAVEIDIGPSYRDSRAEALDKLTEMSRNPAMGERLGSVGADVMVKLLDNPEMDALAKRLEQTIPPNIRAASNPTSADQLRMQASQLQQTAQQQHQLLQQQHAQMQEMQQEIERLKAANETKLAISQQNNETKLQVEQMRQGGENRRLDVENAHDAAMVDHTRDSGGSAGVHIVA